MINMRTAHEDKALGVSETKDDLGPVSRTTRALRDALSGYEVGKACPHCGSLGKHCRPVPAGYWCQADGLLADDAAFVHTEPDPQAEAVKADPQRRVAELLYVAAQQDFEAADLAWRNACAATEHARTSARRTEPVFDQSSPTGWRATREATTLARSVPRLEAAAADAKRVRDAREIELGIARRDYQRAYDGALRRAGLPQTNSNVAPTDLHSLVGGSW